MRRATEDEALIRLEGVGARFPGGGGRSVQALVSIDLEVRRGETLALIGPSGSGKTTCLRLINRLLEPSEGRVLLGGEPVRAQDKVRLRRRMGYVLQSGALFPHLTVARNIGLLCALEGWERERIEARVDELLRLVRLSPGEFRARFPGELSGGQAQRVGVARALALDPEILLMDEPFGALDPLTRGRLQQEFLELESEVEKTVVLVTHDLAEAFLLADRVALLRGGHLLRVATPAALRAAPSDPWIEEFLSVHSHAFPG